MRDYAQEAQEILDDLAAQANDSKFAAYRPGLEYHQRQIRATLVGDKPLYELAKALNDLLTDPGQPGDPTRPNLQPFWNLPETQKLRARINRFRETVTFGDPLVVREQYGKGKVVAFLTTAGRAWNDWAGGSMASPTYPVVMLELQKYLTSGGTDSGLTVGSPLELEFDSARYDSKIRRYFQPESRDTNAARAADTADRSAGLVDLKDQLGTVSGSRLSFVFDLAKKPGVYLFELARKSEDPASSGAGRSDQRAFAFNVDPKESDLRRAAKEDLEKIASGIHLRTPGSNWGIELANRQNDLSESAWFYLLFLAVLVAEQALAVHLSFHLKGADTTHQTVTPTTTSVAAL
jgi:hypothetical protein